MPHASFSEFFRKRLSLTGVPLLWQARAQHCGQNQRQQPADVGRVQEEKRRGPGHGGLPAQKNGGVSGSPRPLFVALAPWLLAADTPRTPFPPLPHRYRAELDAERDAALAGRASFAGKRKADAAISDRCCTGHKSHPGCCCTLHLSS